MIQLKVRAWEAQYVVALLVSFTCIYIYIYIYILKVRKKEREYSITQHGI